MTARLGLGTVQFGLDYGITNTAGQCPRDEVAGILALAADRGIRLLDTAATYGTSEEVLGAVLPRGGHCRGVNPKSGRPRAPVLHAPAHLRASAILDFTRPGSSHARDPHTAAITSGRPIAAQ